MKTERNVWIEPWSLTGGDFAPREHNSSLWRHSLSSQLGGAISIYYEVVREAANYPKMLRKAPYNKELCSQDANSAASEKL